MFKEIDLTEKSFNPYTRIGNDWFLITAGTGSHFNAMTGGWGFMGIMWNKKVFEAVIRPDRYTKKLVDESGLFTVSFYPESMRGALMYCGRHTACSEPDKMKNCSPALTPVELDGAVAFEQADEILVCKKLYVQQMEAGCFVDKDVLRANYPEGGLHYAYYGEIIKAYVKEPK